VDHCRAGERREREHDPRGPDTERAGDRTVGEARDRAEAEEGDAPQRHDAAALVRSHVEL
jgi:hypothetical protein